jgi:hypothetical protein
VGGSNPGSTVLASFTNPTAQGSGIFNYTFTPTAPFTFIAGTKYWLYVQSSSGSFDWFSSFPSTTPTGIATSSGNRFNNSGSFVNSSGSFVNSSVFNSFQINATEITGPVASTPEPTAIAALSLFGLGLLGVKGRRNEG